MTPITPAIAELLLAMHTAKRRACDFALHCAQRYGSDPCSDFWPEGELSDHRVAVAGDLAEALDKIHPGMGTDLMQALYPELDLSISTDEALAALTLALATGRLQLLQADDSQPGTPPPHGGELLQ
jgi:hypothetical protein